MRPLNIPHIRENSYFYQTFSIIILNVIVIVMAFFRLTGKPQEEDSVKQNLADFGGKLNEVSHDYQRRVLQISSLTLKQKKLKMVEGLKRAFR